MSDAAATQRRREALADRILDDAALHTDLRLLILDAIENIEDIHPIGSPEWDACVRLLGCDVIHEFAKMQCTKNVLTLDEWLYQANSGTPPDVIMHGREENGDRCWVSWPEDDEGDELTRK